MVIAIGGSEQETIARFVTSILRLSGRHQNGVFRTDFSLDPELTMRNSCDVLVAVGYLPKHRDLLERVQGKTIELHNPSVKTLHDLLTQTLQEWGLCG